MNNEKVNNVKVTSDYSIFKKLLGNRGVDSKRVNSIAKSIKKVGYISNPIIVNEKMEVIDGQGRLGALEQLGLPVEYIVIDGIGLNECVAMNINKINWRIADYVRSYADCGDEHYLRLTKLMDKYPEFGLNVIASAVFKIEKLSAQQASSGRIYITDEMVEDAIPRLEWLREILPYIENKGLRLDMLERALLLVACIDGVDLERMATKVKEECRIMKPFHQLLECLSSLEELYNNGLRNKIYFVTLYRMSKRQQNRYKKNVTLRPEIEEETTQEEPTNE